MALLLTVEDKKNQPELVFEKKNRKKILQANPFDRYKKLQKKYVDTSVCDQMALIDSQVILPDIFLEKVDRSTMAASIEIRVPFLDNDLVDFSQSIASKIKIPKGHQKWLLKKSLDGIVPNEILYGKKIGFEVPFGFWIVKHLKELLFDNLIKVDNKIPGFLDINYIASIHKMHTNNERDFGFLLWKILNLAIWINIPNNNNFKI